MLLELFLLQHSHILYDHGLMVGKKEGKEKEEKQECAEPQYCFLKERQEVISEKSEERNFMRPTTEIMLKIPTVHFPLFLETARCIFFNSPFFWNLKDSPREIIDYLSSHDYTSQ